MYSTSHVFCFSVWFVLPSEIQLPWGLISQAGEPLCLAGRAGWFAVFAHGLVSPQTPCRVITWRNTLLNRWEAWLLRICQRWKFISHLCGFQSLMGLTHEQFPVTCGKPWIQGVGWCFDLWCADSWMLGLQTNQPLENYICGKVPVSTFLIFSAAYCGFKNFIFTYWLLFIYLFLATACSIWDLSSSTRDQTHVPCNGNLDS